MQLSSPTQAQSQLMQLSTTNSILQRKKLVARCKSPKPQILRLPILRINHKAYLKLMIMIKLISSTSLHTLKKLLQHDHTLQRMVTVQSLTRHTEASLEFKSSTLASGFLMRTKNICSRFLANLRLHFILISRGSV